MNRNLNYRDEEIDEKTFEHKKLAVKITENIQDIIILFDEHSKTNRAEQSSSQSHGHLGRNDYVYANIVAGSKMP